MTSTPEIIRSRIIRQHSETRRLDTCGTCVIRYCPFCLCTRKYTEPHLRICLRTYFRNLILRAACYGKG